MSGPAEKSYTITHRLRKGKHFAVMNLLESKIMNVAQSIVDSETCEIDLSISQWAEYVGIRNTGRVAKTIIGMIDKGWFRVAKEATPTTARILRLSCPSGAVTFRVRAPRKVFGKAEAGVSESDTPTQAEGASESDGASDPDAPSASDNKGYQKSKPRGHQDSAPQGVSGSDSLFTKTTNTTDSTTPAPFRQFTDHWLAAKRKENPAHAFDGDGVHVTKIWKAAGENLDLAKRCIDVYMADRSPFYEGHSAKKFGAEPDKWLTRANGAHNGKPATAPNIHRGIRENLTI